MSKRTEIKLEMLGVSGINPFIANNSSPRAVMDFNHVSARPSLLHPDEPLIKTGIEYELGKFINDVRTEHDCAVKGIIRKYMGLGVHSEEGIMFVEYERNGRLTLDMIELTGQKSSHGFFGYPLYDTPEMDSITFNSIIPKDTVLKKAASYGKEGSYNFGVNANVAFMTHPSVAEDGFVVREGFLDKLTYTTLTTRTIYLTKQNLPVNVYGNNDVFKMFPEIGEQVRDDGLLCAIRTRNDWFSVTDLNNEGISDIDYTFDELIYVPKGSVITDIEVVKGVCNKPEYASEMTELLDNYADGLVNYYNNIVSKYNDIMLEHKRMYGEQYKVKITPRLRRFIVDCMIKIQSSLGRNKICYRKIKIDQYRVKITCASTVRPNLGHKLSDKSASKGVICRVLPDEDMPIDELGNRVDIIADAGSSTIGRMNIGRNYEAYMGAFARDNRNNLIGQMIIKYGKSFLHRITDEDVDHICTYLRGMYSLLNSDMVMFIDSLNTEERFNHVKEVLEDNLYLYYPTDNEKNIVQVIDDIEKSPYKPHLGKVTYRDELGRIVTTVDNIRVGNMYYMLLDRIATDFSSVSSAKVNSFNFPIKGNSADKHKHPHSLTPTTTLSETEVRIISSFAEPELIGELMDLALNPTSHKMLVKDILDDKSKAFSTNFNIDRKFNRYGQTKPLLLLRHIFNASGFDFEHSQDETNGINTEGE